MLIILFLILVLLVVIPNVRVVPQAHEYVIEFLGKYKTTWGAGLHIKVPVLEKISKKITLKEQVLDSPPQPVITKDNVTMRIDTVVYFRIFDAKLYTYGVVNPINALENLTATTLRNIVGELELDGTLTSRDTINGKMTAILDDATDQWGIMVNRVELKNIIPPEEIQSAMEKQIKAERDRRETLLQADGLKALKEAGVDAAVLELKKYEALVNLSNGTASKLIIPTDAVNAVTNNVIFSETTGLGDSTKSATKPVKPQKEDPCCK
ncbi:MAG: paraslipin [Clostridia bacterium]|nr:paraslipin [Clostridia bacterium]